MDSRLHGVPLSASQMAPKTAPLTSNNTIITGIRAPLTLDDSDFEYSASSKSRRNSTTSSYYSGSDFESDGSVNGEDELEITPLRNPYGEVVQDRIFSNGNGFSGSSVKNPYGENGRGGGNGGKTQFLRPFVRKREERGFRNGESESDEEIVQDNGYGLGNGGSRRFSLGVGREGLGKNGALPVVSVGMRKVAVPIAKVSGDSDTESQSSEVSEDNGFSGVVRVPSAEVLQRIDSVPKIRISGLEEGEEFEVQGGKMLEGDFDEQVTGNDDVLELKDKEKSIGLEGPVQTVVSSDTVQDKEPDVNEEGGDSSLVANGEYIPPFESESNEDIVGSDDKRSDLSVLPEQTTHSSAAEMGSGFEMAPLIDDEDVEIKNTGEEEIPVGDQKIESDEVENNISEERIDQTVEPFKSDAVGENESVVQGIESGGVQSEETIQFSETEALLEHEQVEFSDELLGDDSLSNASDTFQFVVLGTEFDEETKAEAENSEQLPAGEESSTFSDDKAMEVEIEWEKESISFPSVETVQKADDQVVEDLDEEVAADVGISKFTQVIDSAKLAAFLKASKHADSGIVKLTSFRGLDTFSLGREMESTNGDLGKALSEGERNALDKIQQIRVKYLRLLHRLGLSPEDYVAAHVLHHLRAVEARFSSQVFCIDSARKMAMELEVQNKNDPKFSLNILVIGKMGVGKSATINSIFGERRTVIDAFKPATTKVKEVNGVVNGVQIKVFDTPGLRASFIDHAFNRKLLLRIKKIMRKAPPDVVLYVDRLDTQMDYLNDLPILKLVDKYLGSSIWDKSIVALTHAASMPPDGPDGSPLSCEIFVSQRSQVFQEMITHLSGKMMNLESVLQLCLVENHLPSKENGESLRSKLVLLCCSMKILSEVNAVVLSQTPSVGTPIRSPALSSYLTSLLKSNVQYSSDSDCEEHDEYDDLPPFKSLTKSQIAELSSEQRKAYFDEYDYGVYLLEKKRRREKMRKAKSGETCMEGDADGEILDDPLLSEIPPSFDGSDPSFRYRFPKSLSKILVRPIFIPHGWDHDSGYDGILIEDKIDIASEFPAEISIKLTKEKQKFDLLLQSSVSSRHRDKGLTMAELDIETVDGKLAYVLKGETPIKNFKIHETGAGVSFSISGDNVVPGLKMEDRIVLGKGCVLMGNAGVVQCQDDAAFGASLEACVTHKDYPNPMGLDQSSLGLSLMKCRGDLLWECFLQSQFSVDRNSRLSLGAGLRNNLTGKISVRANTCDQPHLALLAFVPIVIKGIFRTLFPAH